MSNQMPLTPTNEELPALSYLDGAKIGFTGTRKGMTDAQREALVVLIGQVECIDSFHHGCAVGADAEAHAVFDEAFSRLRIYGYPSNMEKQRVKDLNVVLGCSPMAPLDRNNIILKRSDVLIGIPEFMYETQRSGTWSTIRKAKRATKPVFIIWPDGTCTFCLGSTETTIELL